jgi:hypothetical protein
VAKKAVCQKYKEMLGFTPRTVFLCRGSPLAREVYKLFFIRTPLLKEGQATQTFGGSTIGS